MRESMARLTPAFSTNRAVRQYTDEHYIPAASAFRRRAEKKGAMGADLLNWQAQLAKHWPMLRFGSATVEQKEGQFAFQVQVFLDDLDPDAVRVELYAEGQNANAPVTHPLSRGEHLVGSANGFTYTTLVPGPVPPLNTRRDSFPSAVARSCHWRPLSFCGTTHRPGDNRKTGTVMPVTAFFRAYSIMCELSNRNAY